MILHILRPDRDCDRVRGCEVKILRRRCRYSPPRSPMRISATCASITALDWIDSIADRPSESFPKVLDDAALEAAYRFFGNASVTPDAILAPHFRQTTRRAVARREVLVIHDTTQFEFGGDTKREGLGRLIRPGQGFFGHFALATSADGDREPLGLLNLETVFRLDKVSSKPRPQRPNRGESARWR